MCRSLLEVKVYNIEDVADHFDVGLIPLWVIATVTGLQQTTGLTVNITCADNQWDVEIVTGNGRSFRIVHAGSGDEWRVRFDGRVMYASQVACQFTCNHNCNACSPTGFNLFIQDSSPGCLDEMFESDDEDVLPAVPAWVLDVQELYHYGDICVTYQFCVTDEAPDGKWTVVLEYKGQYLVLLEEIGEEDLFHVDGRISDGLVGVDSVRDWVERLSCHVHVVSATLAELF